MTGFKLLQDREGGTWLHRLSDDQVAYVYSTLEPEEEVLYWEDRAPLVESEGLTDV
jgi:hypothetical protein